MSKVTKKKTEELSTATAKQLLEKERQERVVRCQTVLKEVLEKENCQISCNMLVTQQGNQSNIFIIALD